MGVEPRIRHAGEDRERTPLGAVHSPALRESEHACAGGVVTFFADDDDEVIDLEAALEWAASHERASSQREPLFPPVLYRFDLPRTEAPKLLRLLSHEQVDAARLFRGYDGVVEAMRPKSLWDWRAPTG